MNYQLTRQIKFPVRLPTMKLGILGRTGSGKTNTAVVLAEQMIKSGVPVAVLDPQGDWWGLRSRYSIAILGGEHADIPLEPTGGTIAADFVIGERIPVLLDLFTMGEGEMVRFATDFAKRLWTRNREALHVFLDEADLFAPQKSPGADKAKCLSAWQNVCRRGRSRGLGLTMISQRSAVINKDLLTQADPMIIHRLTAPQDLAAVDTYLDFHGYTKAYRKEITAQVSKLDVGKALILSPGELEIEPTLVPVPRRKSFDSGATPEAGQSIRPPKKLADVDLGSLKESMASTIEKAKNNDPKLLQKRIRELEKELRQANKSRPASEAEISQAVAVRDQHWKGVVSRLEGSRTSLINKIESAMSTLALNGEAVPIEIVTPKVMNQTRTPSPPVTKKVTKDAPSNETADWFKPAHQRIIDAVAWLNAFRIGSPAKAIVAAVAGVSPKSSSFSNNVSRLSANGILFYPHPGSVQLTELGREMSNPPDCEPTLAAIHDGWRRCPALKPAHVRLIDVLIDQYPEMISKEQLARAAGVSPTSSSFSNNVSRLSSMGLAEYPQRGFVRAASLLFPEEVCA